jgi:hypothetical protein
MKPSVGCETFFVNVVAVNALKCTQRSLSQGKPTNSLRKWGDEIANS